MNQGLVAGIVLAMTALSGCVEIQHSRYREYGLTKPPDVILLSPQPYLDTTVAVMQACLLVTPSASRSSLIDATLQKLRELEIKEELRQRKIVLEGKRWGGL